MPGGVGLSERLWARHDELVTGAAELIRAGEHALECLQCAGRVAEAIAAGRLLEREAAWLPPWRDLLRMLRRLEARGEIRGGRFVASVTGEQFALPEAVAMLRETRRAPPAGTWISLSGADPLNLAGTIVPGPRVPAITGNRVLYRDGIAVATNQALMASANIAE